MTSDRWQRARDLFERALEEQPADVDAWLLALAPADAALRTEVASLLAHHVRAGSFLAEPVAAVLPDLLDDAEILQPGRQVGDYVIVREIGRGGMGRVYLARDERLGRDVALKALAPHVTHDRAHRERLRREARAAASLGHPGICTVYALVDADDDLFIASEYVDGCTLRSDIVAGRRPTTGELLRAGRELAEALASAHRKGIVHRDLKPENVMRTRDGRWKILDFGLARFDAPPDRLAVSNVTLPGTLAGTPAYMAPEQLKGEVVGPPADVFSFGVLLFEWACGVHPFAAQNPLAQIARVLDSDSAQIATRLAQLPPAAAGIIERCLRKAPGERFASASDIVDTMIKGDATGRAPGAVTWWAVHQLAVMLLYVIVSVLGWHVKETLVPGPFALWLFVGLGIGSALGGLLRGHLLFTEQKNRVRFPVERRRTVRIIAAADLAIAAVLFADGLLTAPTKALWALLMFGLALAIAVAALIMEPATTAAAFGSDAGT